MPTKAVKKNSSPEQRYVETVGRRKEAIARVRLVPAKETTITVNGKSAQDYFPTETLRVIAGEALEEAKHPDSFAITALVRGGGISAQATALRHGITRALVVIEPELRKKLKKMGFIKRDPRAKERRKFGLKKARKSAQWSKR